MKKLIAIMIIALFYTNQVNAESIAATCYEPAGNRIEVIDGSVEEGPDGFSGSNPTFFFSSRDPDFLIESWQAALPFPELISRESVDDIVPPTVTKSTILSRTSEVIYAISSSGIDVYTTALYLTQGFGIFTRVRVKEGYLTDGLEPMGAIYSAKCNFSVID